MRDLQAIRETRNLANRYKNRRKAETSSEFTARIHDINQAQVFAATILCRILTDYQILQKFDDLPDKTTIKQIAEIYDLDPKIILGLWTEE